MAQNAKKIDWAAVLRLLIVVLSAIAEVIGNDSEEEEKKVETKNIDKK